MADNDKKQPSFAEIRLFLSMCLLSGIALLAHRLLRRYWDLYILQKESFVHFP